MMRFRWFALALSAAFVGALFIAAPEQAADVLKAIAPLWFAETPQ